jgi:hypothetical protein
MDIDTGNSSFIYFIIVLCMCIILFYLYYKMYLKLNSFSEKFEKIDKFIANIIFSSEKNTKKTKVKPEENENIKVKTDENENKKVKIEEEIEDLTGLN